MNSPAVTGRTTWPGPRRSARILNSFLGREQYRVDHADSTVARSLEGV